MFYYENHVMGKGYIAILGQHVTSKTRCGLVNMYFACNLSDKIILWEALSNFKSVFRDLAWCFSGDFNVVRSINEREGVR